MRDESYKPKFSWILCALFAFLVLRDCPDPAGLDVFIPLLESVRWLRLIVTSPRQKVDTAFVWPKWVMKKGVWLQLKQLYSDNDLLKLAAERYKYWAPSVQAAIVANSLSSPASVMMSARLLSVLDHPTVEDARQLLGGGPSDVFGFADAFMDKDIPRASRLNVNPYAAMGAIYYRAGLVYRFVSYRNRGFDERLAFETMKLPEFMRNSVSAMARRWSTDKLIELFGTLAQLSMRERSGSGGVLELLLMAAQ